VVLEGAKQRFTAIHLDDTHNRVRNSLTGGCQTRICHKRVTGPGGSVDT